MHTQVFTLLNGFQSKSAKSFQTVKNKVSNPGLRAFSETRKPGFYWTQTRVSRKWHILAIFGSLWDFFLRFSKRYYQFRLKVLFLLVVNRTFGSAEQFGKSLAEPNSSVRFGSNLVAELFGSVRFGRFFQTFT